jgi:ribose 5-phosphate isomerase B
MKIAVGADHGGYALKKKLIKFLEKQGQTIADLGTHKPKRCDYPEFGIKVANAVAGGLFQRGILICKSGIGLSIVANKVPRIRAALCLSVPMARSSREHNNANILVLGANFTGAKQAQEITRVWLNTEFAGGRHARRLKKIAELEKGLKRRENAYGIF